MRNAPRSNAGWLVLARMKPGVSWTQAQEDINRIESRLSADYPASQLPDRAFVAPLNNVETGKYQLSLWLLFGSVLVMLLIACVNTAGLLLARGFAREREFRVRQALGAKRIRLAAQLVTETVVLASVRRSRGIAIGCRNFTTPERIWSFRYPTPFRNTSRLAGDSIYRGNNYRHSDVRKSLAGI